MDKLPRIHVRTPVSGRLSRYSDYHNVVVPRDLRPGTKIRGTGHFRSILIYITDQLQFLFSLETEKWTIYDDKIERELIEPTLSWYAEYPELFLVDESYCSNL